MPYKGEPSSLDVIEHGLYVLTGKATYKSLYGNLIVLNKGYYGIQIFMNSDGSEIRFRGFSQGEALIEDWYQYSGTMIK